MDKRTLGTIIATAIVPHANPIAEIAVDGDVAVVLFEPDPPAETVGRELGWDPSSAPVVRLSPLHAQRLALADEITAAWLERTSAIARVLVLVPGGTLLLNHDGAEWSLEPGSPAT